MYGLLTHNDPHLPQVFSPNARNIPYIHPRLVKQPFTSFSLGGIKWQDFSHVFPTLALAPKLEDAEAAGSSPSWGYAMRWQKTRKGIASLVKSTPLDSSVKTNMATRLSGKTNMQLEVFVETPSFWLWYLIFEFMLYVHALYLLTLYRT